MSSADATAQFGSNATIDGTMQNTASPSYLRLSCLSLCSARALLPRKCPLYRLAPRRVRTNAAPSHHPCSCSHPRLRIRSLGCSDDSDDTMMCAPLAVVGTVDSDASEQTATCQHSSDSSRHQKKRTRFGNGRRSRVDDVVDCKCGCRGREVEPNAIEKDSALNPGEPSRKQWIRRSAINQ
jgi:hypothetical protein